MTRFTKYLSLLLCALLLLGAMSVAYAQEADETQYIQQPAESKCSCCEVPQPQEGPVVIGEVLEGRPTKGVTYHTSEAAAALELRSAMERRESPITIGIRSTAFTQEYIDYIYPTLKNQAVIHTGVDSQGDYLAREYDGYTGSCSAICSGGYYYCLLTYNMKYKTTAQQEADLSEALEQFISANIESDMTDYEMFRVCYDWICQNVTYDHVHLGDDSYRLQYTAYAAMFDGTCVCAGYSELLYRMLLQCNIDNRIITGYVSTGYHAWNIVKLGNYYYNCDSTWDEGVNWQSYDYCLVSPSNFTDHVRDAEFDTAQFHGLYPMDTEDYLAQELYAEKSEVVQQLRQNLKNRAGSFKLCIRLDQAPTADLFQELLSQAVAHNGVPDEGDYLKYHIYSTTPTMEYATVGSKYFVTLSVKAVYYSTAAQETALTAAVDSFIAENIKPGMTDYDKFDAIYSWMSKNIAYGYSGDGGSNGAAYTAMIHKGAAPRGFVTLLYRLMLECGVDCRCIQGTVNSGSNHFWNIVEIDGYYYNVDPGWEASYMQSYGKYRYRLKCDTTFTNHTRNAEFATNAFYTQYPMGQSDYTPAARFNIPMARMVLGNSLEFQFAVPKSAMSSWTGCYAIIEKMNPDGTARTKNVPVSQWQTTTVNGVAYWIISYDDLAAKEMADELYVTLYNSSAKAVSYTRNDSARSYVERNIESQNVKTKTMMADMLAYGAAAQLEFNYNTGDLANSRLTAAQKAYGSAAVAPMSNNRVTGENYKGTRLILESRIQMQVAFGGLDRTMYAIYSYTDHNGIRKTVRVNGADFVYTNNMYCVELNQLVCADARCMVTVQVYKADGTLFAGVKDSIESYACRFGATGIYAALMKFTDSAYNYFH